MFSIRTMVAISILSLVFSVNSTYGQDLSSYRGFHFGMTLPDAVKQTGIALSEAKTIHVRPALIQELNWDIPFSINSSVPVDSMKGAILSFYNGQLYRIVVNYDNTATRGLTAEDLAEVISAKYGSPTTSTPTFVTIPVSGGYSNDKAVDEVWEDSQYSFTLFHSSYQPNFGVMGLSKRLDLLARTAQEEAARLDQQEAPRLEISRKKQQDEKNRAAMENARAVNKPKFQF